MSTLFPLTVFAKDAFGGNSILPEDTDKKYQDEKAALQVLEKFCSDKVIVGKKELVGEAKQYMEITQKLKSDIYESQKYTKDDKLGTVVCNTMLLAHNVRIKEQEKDKQVDMVDYCPTADEICGYFDEKNRISKKHEIYKKVDGKFAIRSEKVKRVRKKLLPLVISVMLIGITLLTLSIIGYSQKIPTPEKPAADDIFDSISNWWNYDLWNKELPVAETPKLRLYASKFLTIGGALVLICLMYLFAIPVINSVYLKLKKRAQYMTEWCEFQYLCKLFEYAEKNMF